MSFLKNFRKQATTLALIGLSVLGIQATVTSTAHAAAFTISSSSGTASVGTYYSGYTVTSSNYSPGFTNYTIDQPSALTTSGLTFDASSGTLTGVPAAPLAATMFTITEYAGGGGVQTQTFTLTINAATTPIFSLSSSSETATVGSAITGYTITSLGTPITGYSISPAPSNGITFSSATGLLSGFPLAAHADITYTIGATDGMNTTYQTFDLTVNAAVPTTPAFTLSNGLENGSVGTPIVGYSINSTGDLITHYSISPAVANGLAFSTTTGLLSGIPNSAAAGNSYSISAYDASGNTAIQTFILLVSVPVPTTPAFTLSQSSETVNINTLITGYTINSTGDTITSYSVSPSLPANGLSFDTTTGLITGAPNSVAAGTTYTITASDAAHNTASQTYSLTVNTASAPVITYYPKQEDSIASFYPAEISPNVSRTITFSGNFPAPITNIALNNVMLTANNFVITWVSKSVFTLTLPPQPAGSAAILDFYDGETPLIGEASLTVQQAGPALPPTVIFASPDSTILAGAVGAKFSAAIKATATSANGDSVPVTYSISSGELPKGLTLNTDGSITGTPTEVSDPTTVIFRATVSSGLQAFAEQTYQIHISPTLTLTASLSGKQVAEKTVVTNIGEQLLNPIQLSTTGGVGGVSIYVDPSNVLPIGLTFDQTTNTLNGNGFPLTGIYGADEDDLSITFDATDSGATPQIATYVLTLDLIPTLQLQLFRGFHSFIPSVGDPFSYDLSEDLQGGKKPYSFQLTKGKLPKGVTLTSAGVLSGVINSPGDTSITVTVTDSGSPTQTYDEDFYLLASNNDA